MNTDPTEAYRMARTAELNAIAGQRAEMEKTHGKVWDTTELQQEFSVISFSAPFVVARRKSDGKLGSLEFQHSPRFYFNWVQD